MSWLIDENMEGHEIGYRAILDKDGFTVCNPSPMGARNAALIAAAPDLLAALLAFRDGGPNGGRDFEGWHAAYASAIELARAAIAKAEGANHD